MISALGSQDMAQISTVLDVKQRETPSIQGMGPTKAAAGLCNALPNVNDRAEWAVVARIEAIVGSCPRSMDSAKSGMRAWLGFFRNVLGKTGNAFPPLLDDLLAWSRLFQHEGTFRNYLFYVRLGCELTGMSVDVFDHPSMRRAKIAVAKRGLATKRKPRFIRQDILAG